MPIDHYFRFTAGKPLEVTVKSVERVHPNSEIYNIALDHRGLLPFVEGQSLGVIPEGLSVSSVLIAGSANDGKPHRQRLYSIASDRNVDGATDVSLCVRRAFATDKNGQPIPGSEGLCSNYLCSRQPGDRILVTGPVGKSMLLPDEPAPLVMVATGTGIAPFRGFWRRRKALGQPQVSDLYIGARSIDQVPYLEELLSLAKQDDTFEFATLNA